MTPRAVDVGADHPAFAGHFPGDPLWPGVLLVAEALEAVLAEPALAARVGAAPRLVVAKFTSPVRPGTRLAVSLTARDTAIDFRIADGDRICASGQFAATTA